MRHRAGHGIGTHRAATLGVIAATVLLAACGLGDKAALEERITAAPERFDATVVAGTMTVESRLAKVPAGSAPGAAGAVAALGGGSTGEAPKFPEEGISFGTVTVGFALDLGASRAVLTAAGAPATEPTVLLDDLDFYGRRGGVPADDARPWVRFDLDHLDDTAGELDPFDRGLDAVWALHPAVVTDLVAGTLTGSIETAPPAADPAADAVNGVPTTHYEVNVSLDKAFSDIRRSRYPEDRREMVDDLLQLLGIDGDLHPADVWLDADGRVRRFRVELTQEPIRQVEFRLVVTLEFTEVGAGPALAVTPPGPDLVLGVDSVVRFVRTVAATGDSDTEDTGTGTDDSGTGTEDSGTGTDESGTAA